MMGFDVVLSVLDLDVRERGKGRIKGVRGTEIAGKEEGTGFGASFFRGDVKHVHEAWTPKFWSNYSGRQ